MLWPFSRRWLSHLHGQMSNPGDVTCVQLPPGRYFLQWFLAPVASAAPPAGGPRKMTRVIAGRIVRKGKQRFLPVTACARSVGPAVRSVVGAGFAAGPPLSVRVQLTQSMLCRTPGCACPCPRGRGSHAEAHCV